MVGYFSADILGTPLERLLPERFRCRHGNHVQAFGIAGTSVRDMATMGPAIAEPVMLLDVVLQISASMGVTLYPQDGADADQLLRHASQAMYLAKQAGKNCCHMFDVVRDTAQGYGIARPMPAAALMDWVASWRPDPSWAGLPQPDVAAGA